ncbi:hypothetical protein [Phytohabitans houttuyneae]|uniref:Uncharacterized protein n=1 Tax=Phytohabitans houttuyneae TaxID=1076126 RepID=A0A6V8K9L6_9ACTN|nr:hypothetical protein [Phytohabitans houttuyneae]GFJ81912.1 hypothetical protein Phou_060920 [Phytohabitans houttuyneae]
MTTPRASDPHCRFAEPARRAAWHTYLTLTCDLLPALDSDPADTGRTGACLTQVISRILIWAPAWGPPGAVLAAATYTAQRLHRDGDHLHLARLLRVLARRLFSLSSGRTGRPRPRPT